MHIIASQDQFVFGEHRRHMKTIGYLGQIDKLFGAPATTRNWNTIVAIVRILKARGKGLGAIDDVPENPLSSLPSCQLPCGRPLGSDLPLANHDQ